MHEVERVGRQIFLDDRNIPDFDVQQFEGRIETPIEKRTVGIFFFSANFSEII